MRTLGLDLSSQPKDTAACVVEWSRGRIVAQAPVLGCNDRTLDALIREVDVVGIDAPFGWPEAFVAAVAGWRSPVWDDATLQKNLRLRLTDVAVHAATKLTPLSVSTDRIALPAMRTMALLTRHGVTDKSGDGRFYEVYPAGSLKQWGLPFRSYKGPEAAARKTRRALLSQLRAALPALEVAEAVADSDHGFDALIAALTARAARAGQTLAPATEAARATARREGWIHLPTGWPR